MPSLNLIDNALPDIARSLRLTLIARKGPLAVLVRDSGAVLVRREGEYERLPENWIVGVYTRAASVVELEEDLDERKGEILASRETLKGTG